MIRKMTAEEFGRVKGDVSKFQDLCSRIEEENEKKFSLKIYRFFELIGVIAVVIAVAMLMKWYE
jgi:hypothetical protein